VPAEIGCYLSHMKAWRRIAEDEAPGGFIFEDDFAATEALVPVLLALSEDRTGDWDMAKLFTLHPDVTLSGSAPWPPAPASASPTACRPASSATP
jgi:glycosyl transferase family 25